MKRDLNDYRKEMQEIESRSSFTNQSVSANSTHARLKKEKVETHSSQRWAKLLPGLMAILMAILTLLFLIISEALKKN